MRGPQADSSHRLMCASSFVQYLIPVSPALAAIWEGAELGCFAAFAPHDVVCARLLPTSGAGMICPDQRGSSTTDHDAGCEAAVILLRGGMQVEWG